VSQDFFAELQLEFLVESLFMMEQYEEGMLALENQEASDEVMAQIFRVARSIKGGAAAVGFQDLAGFAHVVEDLLSLVRTHTSLISPEIISLLLESGDVFRNRLTDLQAGNAGEWDTSELKGRLVVKVQECNAKVGNAPAPAAPAAPAVPAVEAAAPELTFPGEPVAAATPTPEPVAPVAAAPAAPAPEEDHCNHELLAELMAQMGGEAPAAAPAPEAAVPSAAPAPPKLELVPNPAPVVAAAPVAKPGAAKPAASAGDGGAKGKPTNNSGASGTQIKVDIGRVDSVLDAVGEIVVLKNQLVHDDMVRDGEHPRVAAIVDQLDKLVRELYDKTLSIRMTPLKSLFIKIQRLVRDVSLQLGKPVNLKLQGEETEVERTVFEVLGDPLVHLVRNSMDHGIEKPEGRKEKGKPATATVVVSAKQVGGTVVIEITDDGGGISREKVLKKAMEKNLVPAGRDPETLRDEEVFQFIFAPGFSTAEKITDLSGRGVGLDVVRSNLEKVHGKIDITSKKDVGTTFRLSIPLSTAITDGILVAAQGSRYILPIHSIREIVRAVPKDYTNISGVGRVVKIREVLIPVCEAERVLGQVITATGKNPAQLTENEAQSLRSRRGETMLIIIESMHGQVAFPVDDVLGQAQVVVKPLQAGSQIPEVAGAAILGDGRTVLILDPQALVNRRHQSNQTEAAA